MRRIIFLTFFSVAALFGKTETIELTGKYSEQLGNPFKRVLNINKSKTINIYSENKDVVLKVNSNLESGNFIVNYQHPYKIVLKNKSVEKVVEDFYSEDFIIKHSKSNAINVNVVSGSVYLTYGDERTNGINHLIGIEVNLLISVNGKEMKITMNHNVEKPVAYRGQITSDDFNLNIFSLLDSAEEIIENIIYKGIK